MSSFNFNDRFLRACRRETVDCTPIWFMRQAGRYQPEYRRLRETYSLIEICHNPDLCAEVTLLPVRQLHVDAAILFSDISLLLGPMGVQFQIEEGVGPVIERPIRSLQDLERLRPLTPETDLPFVLETIRLLRRELRVPLIGFAGAPFTLASYLIEGGPSRAFIRTKALIYQEPVFWHRLLEKLTDAVARFLHVQVQAGAQALQIFDSWVGCLSPSDYREYIQPHMSRLFAEIRATNVPIIHFGVNTHGLLELMSEAGGDVIGIDWRVHLDRAWNCIGSQRAIQGNLDPALLLGPWRLVEQRAREILEQAGGDPGHIFNLGHGVLPETSPDQLKRLVELVHTQSSSPSPVTPPVPSPPAGRAREGE
ncbi:uroporphyrinogen decarboxylase, partial [Candidatus Acetothermia bacterium]|nr:uroporphyrinogen decarboxylase [Candidatus Acetothermia bacterium]